MKKLVIAVLVVFSFTVVKSQSFEEGSKVVQLGIGLGSSFGLPIGASFEFGITEKIGVGAYFGYASKTYDIIGNEYKVTNILFGARGNYHFYNTDKIDAYGSLVLGYNVAKAEWVNTSLFPIPASYGGVFFGGVIGGRYYFTEKLAGFGELGYGIGYLTLGIAVKL